VACASEQAERDPTRLRPLLDAWVAAGYVVAASSLLVTENDADGDSTSSASARQTTDARFVLDQLLLLNADPSSVLHGFIEPDHIGTTGMSLGSLTVCGLVSNTCCRDRRIAAALMLAAVYRPLPEGKYVKWHVPILLLQGDQNNGYHNSVSAYPKLGPPKWFITLHGSTHSPPFELPAAPKHSSSTRRPPRSGTNTCTVKSPHPNRSSPPSTPRTGTRRWIDDSDDSHHRCERSTSPSSRRAPRERRS
jgi:hypothetical protein